MKLKVLRQTYAVVKLPPELPIPEWAVRRDELLSVSWTSEELSIVCPSPCVPGHLEEAAVETGWRGIKVEGMLDFGLTGILASLAVLLARERISIFAVSTYNTDYLLVKEAALERAIAVLQQEGHEFITEQ